MSTAKTASNKKGPQRVRKLNGELVKPCLYNGRAVGGGKYLAAMKVNGDLVLDEQGVPVQYRSAELVDA